MKGRAHGDGNRLLSDHIDRLRACLEINPFPVGFILLGIIGIDFFNEQIHHIRARVGKTPGDIVVVSDDDARHTREGKPAHFIRALIVLREAVHIHLIPYRRHLDAKMRIVRQDRHTRCCM